MTALTTVLFSMIVAWFASIVLGLASAGCFLEGDLLGGCRWFCAALMFDAAWRLIDAVVKEKRQ